MNKVYFTSEKGISISEAGTIRGIAAEICERNEEKFKRTTCINCNIDLIGSDNNQPKPMSIGLTKDQLENYFVLLEQNGKLHALQAWLGEATNEKNKYIEEIEDYEFSDIDIWMDEDTKKSYQEHIKSSPIFKHRTKLGWIQNYLEENPNICLIDPKRPESPKKISEKDVIDSMNIKERAEYLYVEAIASTYGQSIHKGGFLEKARKEFAEKLSNPIDCNEDGRNTVLKYYSGSVSESELENFYMEIQKKHRDFESRLNSLKLNIKKTIEKQYLEDLDKYNKDLAIYKIEKEKYDRWYSNLGILFENALQKYNEDRDNWNSIEAEFVSKFNEWKQNKLIEASKLKINIPNKYQETFDFIKNLISSEK